MSVLLLKHADSFIHVQENHTVPHQHVELMHTNKETLKRNQDMPAGLLPGFQLARRHLLKCLRFQV